LRRWLIVLAVVIFSLSVLALTVSMRAGIQPSLLTADEEDFKELLAVAEPGPDTVSPHPAKTGTADLPPDAEPSTGGPTLDTAAFTRTNKINILFLGIDRTEERENSSSLFRADTIAVIRFDLDTRQVNILSIPRDTYTYLPITGKKDKINHAYAYGSAKGNGAQAMIDAIGNFSGDKLPVDYFLALDMEPLPRIVDEIGGVEIDVEIAMKTHGANLDKGLQLLNGRQAFDYIHWRFAGMGDIDRIKRQQKFFRAMYKKQRDSGQLLETVGIVLKYKDYLKTNLTPAQLYGLAQLAKDIPPGSVTYLSIPGHSQTINKISHWIPDHNKKREIIATYFNR